MARYGRRRGGLGAHLDRYDEDEKKNCRTVVFDKTTGNTAKFCSSPEAPEVRRQRTRMKSDAIRLARKLCDQTDGGADRIRGTSKRTQPDVDRMCKLFLATAAAKGRVRETPKIRARREEKLAEFKRRDDFKDFEYGKALQTTGASTPSFEDFQTRASKRAARWAEAGRRGAAARKAKTGSAAPAAKKASKKKSKKSAVSQEGLALGALRRDSRGRFLPRRGRR